MMHVNLKTILSIICTLLFAVVGVAQERLPGVFTYQGRAFQADGVTPLSGNATFSVQVRSANGNCLLYQETHNAVDLTASSGFFALNIGDGTASTGLAMTDSFSNLSIAKTTLAGTCGGAYTPLNQDSRVLRITVDVGGGPIALDDQYVYTAPQALVADTLSGFRYNEFVQSLSTVQRDALTAMVNGTTIYNISTGRFNRYDGAAWIEAFGATNVGAGSQIFSSKMAGNDWLQLRSIVGSAGITATQNANDITLSIDPAYTQRRLTGAACGAGEFIKSVAQDGTITCAAGGAGTVTSVTATNGTITMAGTGAAPTVALSTCADDQVLKMNGAVWNCEADVDTDTNTTYTAGSGLALTGTVFSIPANGVVTSMITDDNVTAAKIADDAIDNVAKIATTLCAANEVLKKKSDNSAWECAADDGATISGTAKRIAMFNAAGNNVENSLLEDDETDINVMTGRSLDVADSKIKFSNILFAHQTGGTTNTFIGTGAGNTSVTGTGNAGLGNNVLLLLTTGNNNIASGSGALYSNTAGNNNIASGPNALYNNTTGSNNIASGFLTLKDNTTGSNNIAMGGYGLNKNTTGSSNVATGYSALYNNTTGSNNIAVGHASGYNANAGSTANVFLGNYAGPTVAGTISNQLYINNAVSDTPLIYGEFDNNFVRINNRLQIPGLGASPTDAPAGMGQIFSKTDGKLYFKYASGTEYDLTSTGAGGETNTASNQGTGGVGVFDAKSASDLQFRNISAEAGNEISVTLSTKNIVLDVVEANLDLDTIGGVLGLTDQVTGVLPVANGGTGASALGADGILVMNGTGTEATSVDCGLGVNQVLQWTGAAWACSGVGVVTSVTAGAGLVLNVASTAAVPVVDVNVDDSTIEINADTVRVKDLGITGAKIAAGAIDNVAKIATTLCAANEVLKKKSDNSAWECAADDGATISGTAKRIAMFNAAGNNVENSLLEDDETDINVMTGRSLDVADSRIKFNNALFIHQTGAATSTFVGASAGTANTGGWNTALGNGAMASNVGGTTNVAIGYQSLNQNVNGGNNLAIGYQSLYANTGSYNIAVGTSTLKANTSGSYNIATGYMALTSNTTGTYNVANGYNALYSNTTGTNNIAIGNGALYTNTTGINNIASGYQSLYNNTTGTNNIASGYQSLFTNSSGFNNIATGYRSQYLNTTGINNISNGYQSLYSNTTGGFNIANGYQALYANTTGANNIANGRQALFSNTIGSDNIANGFLTLYSNTTGSNNIANGYNALYANTTGNYNIANGYYALYLNTIGIHNMASGFQALYNNTTGNYNMASGYQALFQNTTGSYSIASGYQSLYNNTTGEYNIATGYRALYNNVTGTDNIAIGRQSLNSSTSGSFNIGMGYQALFNNTTSIGNIATGYRTLYNNTIGSHNVASGYYALFNNVTGNNNTAIGFSAGININAGSTANVFLGNNAGPSGAGEISNKLYIHNTSGTPLIYGDFSGSAAADSRKVGINKIASTYALEVNGSVDAVAYYYTSDGRLKHNVETLDSSLAKILQLRGVSFDWNESGKHELGLIAQEVEEIYPTLVSTNKEGFKAVKYGNLVAPLIESTKELYGMCKMQEEQMARINERVENNTRDIASIKENDSQRDAKFEKLLHLVEKQQQVIEGLQKEIKLMKSNNK